MDTAMLRKIVRNHNKSDIKKLQEYISRTRLYAEKNHGFLKKYLHNEANRWEKNLKEILR